MALDVRGKTALITGGGSGICLALTKALLDAGGNVLIADLTLTGQAKDLFATTGGAKLAFAQTDVTSWAQLQSAFEQAITKFGQLDIVVPGAGVFEPKWSSFWDFNAGVDTTSTDHFKSMEINVTHPIRATQLAIDSFARQKHGHGVVILISSIAAQLPLLPTPIYSASKAAISAFTRSLANLEPTRNIRVSAVAPGVVKTPIWTADKLVWVDEKVDEWVPIENIVKTMMDLITDAKLVGGTVLEVGLDHVRALKGYEDALPSGRGHTVAQLGSAVADVYGLLDSNFGKNRTTKEGQTA